MPEKSQETLSVRGVTVEEQGRGQYRVRWRDKVAGSWKSREQWLHGDEHFVRRFVGACAEARDKLGWFDAAAWLDANVSRPEGLPEAANLLDGIEAFISAREAAGKFRGKTATTYRSYAWRLAESIHAIRKIPKDAPLPVTLLGRELFVELMARDTARGASAMMSYASLRLLVDAWRWLSGEPKRFPQVPPLPPSTRDLLPRTPKYGRTAAPTVAHVDACLRHLRANDNVSRGTLVAAIFLRYTGLRVSQVLGIDKSDLDLQAKTLLVRVAKSERERADLRTVPLAAGLLAEPEVAGWLASTATGPLFPSRRHSTRKYLTQKPPVVTLKAAWERATEAGEVPKHVWAPPNRKFARPDHAFRAFLQAHLRDEGVADDVIDFLVGHEGDGVRDVHYGRDLMDRARDALDALPPVDWAPPGSELPENVVPMVRG